MTAYKKYNGTGNESSVIAAAEKVLSEPAVLAFLSAPDSFGPGGSDANMVLCTILLEATPMGLATFAANTTVITNSKIQYPFFLYSCRIMKL